MSFSILAGLLFFSILDSLNPATIATMMMLLPTVKKKWYSLIFIIGTFVIYLVVGLILFFGGDKLLSSILWDFFNQHAIIIGYIEIVIGLIASVIVAMQLIKLFKKILNRELGQKDYMSVVSQFASPFTLLVLSITATLSDVPTAMPYFGFIGMLTVNHLEPLKVIILLLLYCLVYVFPMIVLYFAYSFIKGEKFVKIESAFRNFINKISEFAIPIMLIFLVIFMLWDGTTKIFV